MILSIESSLSTFKRVEFHAGVNILLSEKTDKSTDKQTRNSAGKTSLIEIIHFLYGADCEKDSLFRTVELIDESFSGRMRISGTEFIVSRSGKDPSKIYIHMTCGAFDSLLLRMDKATERFYTTNANWRIFLGHMFFGLPADERHTSFEESYSPTFRSLFSYFVRRRGSGAFISPERSSEKQQRWDYQVNLSYLLGLNWELSRELNSIRQREKTLEELKKAAKGGAFGSVIGTVAELRPQVTVATAKAEKLRRAIEGFEVLESYKDLSKRAAQTKSEMQRITADLVSLNETREHLAAAMDAETPPARSDIEKLYQAVGVELPNVVLRRYEDVTIFNESIVKNRRLHLETELQEVYAKISAAEAAVGRLDTERARILVVLRGKGALDDFLALQRNLAECEAAAANLRERYIAAELLEGESTKLDIDRANLKRRLQEDHQAKSSALQEAILLIESTISELYDDRSGGFVVEATDNGPEFRISIEGDRGGGIANIEIFCFDMALFEIVSKKFEGPGFLVHDSHLFDGVDERQISSALYLAFRAVQGKNLQYIITMNSDIFDRLPNTGEWDPSSFVLKTRLSDRTEHGGLFGFRFG